MKTLLCLLGGSADPMGLSSATTPVVFCGIPQGQGGPRNSIVVSLILGTILLAPQCIRADQGTRGVPEEQIMRYPAGRPASAFRLEAKDHGVVLKHGDGPEQCDYLGARDVWVYEDKGTYYMHYDGSGPKGWLACLATSTNLVDWVKKGPVLDFGKPGEEDSAGACYGVTYSDGKSWHMFYLGTPNAAFESVRMDGRSLSSQ